MAVYSIHNPYCDGISILSADPNVDVIYVAPVPINEEMAQPGNWTHACRGGRRVSFCLLWQDFYSLCRSECGRYLRGPVPINEEMAQPGNSTHACRGGRRVSFCLLWQDFYCLSRSECGRYLRGPCAHQWGDGSARQLNPCLQRWEASVFLFIVTGFLFSLCRSECGRDLRGSGAHQWGDGSVLQQAAGTQAGHQLGQCGGPGRLHGQIQDHHTRVRQVIPGKYTCWAVFSLTPYVFQNGLKPTSIPILYRISGTPVPNITLANGRV